MNIFKESASFEELTMQCMEDILTEYLLLILEETSQKGSFINHVNVDWP